MSVNAIFYAAGLLGVVGIVLAMVAWVSFSRDLHSQLSDFLSEAIRYWAISVLLIEVVVVVFAVAWAYSQ